MTWKKMDNWYSSTRNIRIVRIQDDGVDINIKTATFDETAEDWDNLSDEELINKVHEWDYRQNMLGKFVNEAVEISEANAKEAKRLAEQIKESTDLLEQLKTANEEYKQKMTEMTAAIEESNQSTTRNNELIKTVSLTINELIAELMGGEEDDEVSEED